MGRVLILLFAVLVAVMLLNQIYVTPLSISDTDASTYVIVPMLMLPLFALFMAKENIVPFVGKKDILLGVILFAVFLLLGKYLETGMGYLYASYGMEMLIFPIAIAAMATLLFGARNLGKFSFIAAYALFASALLLLPIINFNSQFTTLNSLVVYHIAKVFLPGVTYLAPTTLMLNGISISIGEACVGIGALIGMVMFLMPLAYLYNGTARRKLAWVISGFLLLLVLNVVRMSAIATLWFENGPNQQLLNIHSVAGQLLFYAVVALMVLLAGAYKLEYPEFRPKKGTGKQEYQLLSVSIAIILAVAYYLATMPLAGAQMISPVLLSSSNQTTFSYSSLVSFLPTVANLQNYSSQSIVSSGDESAAVYVYNISRNETMPLILLFGAPNMTLENDFLGSAYEYKSDGQGNIATLYEFYYNNTYNFVYYRQAPYYLGGEYYDLDMYVVMPFYPSFQSASCQSGAQMANDALINALYLNFQNSTTSARMEKAYCFISRVVK